jgi:outer membrane protein OmpA-like peptidoglycan-associated protein
MLTNKIWLLVFLLFSVTVINAQQNLIANCDFEDINDCAEYHSECGVEAWFYLANVKAELSHANDNHPLLGNNTLTVFYKWGGSGTFYPVVGTVLPCLLQPGHRYTFTGLFTAKFNNRLILRPGVAMGEKFYVQQRPFSLNMIPDSIMEISKAENVDLYRFEYSFTASGNEKYLTFGTFIKNNLELVKEDLDKGVRYNWNQQENISLTIDHFQLKADDPAEIACADYERNKQNIYAYDFRHRDMDYTLYAKGELPIKKSGSDSGSITRIDVPVKPLQIPIQKEGGDTILLGDVLFDFNEAGLKPAATEILNNIFIQKIPGKNKRVIDSIAIEGHTDAIGSENDNLILSRKRCQSVRDWLVKGAVLLNDKISIHPFGKSRPVSSNKTVQGRALNRRVELIVFYKP